VFVTDHPGPGDGESHALLPVDLHVANVRLFHPAVLDEGARGQDLAPACRLCRALGHRPGPVVDFLTLPSVASAFIWDDTSSGV
jgi:hypothetical protein